MHGATDEQKTIQPTQQGAQIIDRPGTPNVIRKRLRTPVLFRGIQGNPKLTFRVARAAVAPSREASGGRWKPRSAGSGAGGTWSKRAAHVGQIRSDQIDHLDPNTPLNDEVFLSRIWSLKKYRFDPGNVYKTMHIVSLPPGNMSQNHTDHTEPTENTGNTDHTVKTSSCPYHERVISPMCER